MEKSNKEKAKELYPTDFNYLGSGVINVPVKEREAFVKGAEWKEQQMIEKATYWLSIHMLNNHPYSIVDVDCFIRDFAKAMKGE